MSVGTRNTIAIVVFVVVFFWAAGTAEPRSGYGYAPGGGYASVVEVICDVFGKRKCAAARKVAWCESRLRPAAVSSTGDVGLFQANFSAHHWPGESFTQFRTRMVDPVRNTRFAHRLSRGGTTWSAWRWSRHCHGMA